MVGGLVETYTASATGTIDVTAPSSTGGGTGGTTPTISVSDNTYVLDASIIFPTVTLGPNQSYTWRLANGSPQAAISGNGSTAPQVFFPQPGTYTFEFVVTDSQTNTSTTYVVVVNYKA